jgi:two-component system nitrogen regulation response regulator NtrX
MRRRLLVIDDDADIRESVTLLLEGEGYEVRPLGSGEEVIAAMQRGDFLPEVILLDQIMPRMSGDELRLILQRDGKWSKVPIIFCSGDSVSAEARRSVFAVLEKPFEIERLFALVKSATDR